MKQILWIGLYAFVNLLFVAKYAPPVLGIGAGPALAAGIVAIGVAAAACRSERILRRLTWSRAAGAGLAVGGALLLLLLLRHYDESALAVARLAARREWIDSLLSGDFPYGTDSRPSGLPVLFLVALPFHLLGVPGLLQVAAFALFARFTFLSPDAAGRGRPAVPARVDVRPLLLLLASPLFLYEVAVRSDLFANMVLLILYARLLDHTLAEPGRTRRLRLFVVGVAGGLVVATRLITLIVLFLFAGRCRRRGPVDTAILAAGHAIGFLAAVLPFLAWDPALFLDEGPLAVQGAYIAPQYVVPVIVLSIVMGLRVRTTRETWECAAILLFAMILLPFLHTVALAGVDDTLFGDRFDISWFAFCLPFLLLAMADAPSRARPPPRR